jgi:G3E family GTPase
MIDSSVKETKLNRKPAYVLVGFLGSGKTTLLGKLIGWCLENGMTPGLIVNEFGAVSIDGEMMRQEGMILSELSNGCICCTAEGDLIPALIQMSIHPKVDLIILEASGLADPADMLDELTDPALWEAVEVGGIISVVDALRFDDLAEKTRLAQRQVEYADVLVMNKCDLVTEADALALKEQLIGFNPKAQIFPAQQGLPEAGIEALLDLARSVGAGNAAKKEHTHHQHDHSHNHHGEADAHMSLHTLDFDMDLKLNKDAFEKFLKNLPPNVYRAKGFLWVEGDERPHVFQQMPGYVRVLPFQRHRPSLMRGVFIGQNLDKAWILQQIEACIVA